MDYLAEILKELRKDDYSGKIKDFVELDSSLTARDRDGVLKTFSGLMKILFPDGDIVYEDAIELIEFSIECRKRIKDQLIKMDETFEKVNFVYNDVIKNVSKTIETPENKKHLSIDDTSESFSQDEVEKTSITLHEDEKDIEEKDGNVFAENIQDIIEKGESAKVEFKSSLRWDIRKNKMNKSLEKEVLKTIAAFLNFEGGTLLIGVDDDGNVLGLENDFHLISKKNKDGFQNHLVSLITSSIGMSCMQFVNINFENIAEKKICRANVKSSKQPVFLNIEGKQKLYIRTGNSTREISGQQMLDYTKDRFG